MKEYEENKEDRQDLIDLLRQNNVREDEIDKFK